MVASLNRDTFLQIYLNEIGPRTAVLTGQLHVKNFAYNSLATFAECFDSSTESWNNFYEFQKQQASLQKSSPISLSEGGTLDDHLDAFIDNLSKPSLSCLKSHEMKRIDQHVLNVSSGMINYRLNNPLLKP